MMKTNVPAKIAAVKAAGCSDARNGKEADDAFALATQIYRESLALAGENPDEYE
jgi:hypothetical protein